MNFQPFVRKLLSALSCLAVISFATPLLADDEFLNSEEALQLNDAEFSLDRIQLLIKSLDDKDVKHRLEAIEGLGKRGAEARPAVPKLIDLLSDEATYSIYGAVWTVRDQAARSLAAIGAESVGPLVEAYPKKPGSVQRQISFTARQIGPAARAFAPVFAKQIAAGGVDAQGSPLSELAAVDYSGNTAIPLLLRSLRSGKHEWERHGAAEFLVRADRLQLVYWKERAPAQVWFNSPSAQRDQAADALISALNDPLPNVRAAAAITLSTYPEYGTKAFAALVHLLDDKANFFIAYSNHVGGGASVASAAAKALAAMHSHADTILALINKSEVATSPDATEVVASLAVHTKSPIQHLSMVLDGPEAEYALAPLARLGNSARAVIPKLKTLIKDNNSERTAKVQLTIACIDPQGNPETLKAAKRLVEFSTQDACQFLSGVGKNAHFAVPELQKCLPDKSSEGEHDMLVLRTLSIIGSDSISAAPLVIESLDSGFQFYADDREGALVSFGPGVVPLLIKALELPDKSATHFVSCLNVLSRLGNLSAAAVPSIAAHRKSSYPRVREAVAQALGQIAPPKEALEVLKELAADPRPFVRAAAIRSCGQLGPKAEQMLPQLIAALDDSYVEVQVAAVTALGQIGPAANNATARLEKLSERPDVLLRETIQEALLKIRPTKRN